MHTPDPSIIRFNEPERVDSVLAYARRLINRSTRGRFDLHYDTRTVTLTDVNADAAMRMTSLIANHDPNDPELARWAEHCDPETSDGMDRWVNLEVGRVLSSDWHPERLIIEDNDRKAVAAAFRLLDADADADVTPAAIGNWEVELLEAYATLLAHQRGATRAESRPPTPNASTDRDETGIASESDAPGSDAATSHDEGGAVVVSSDDEREDEASE